MQKKKEYWPISEHCPPATVEELMKSVVIKQRVSGLNFDAGTSRIRRSSTDHYTFAVFSFFFFVRFSSGLLLFIPFTNLMVKALRI